MTLDAYNAVCGALRGATHVIQWGDAEVWKVGAKVFAIGREGEGGEMAVTFKCSELAFRLLAEQPGLRGAPYLASRGLTWIQRVTAESMDDATLADYLAESHRLIALKLTRAVRRELGLTA